MNKYTEQQIEEKLNQLASIEPSGDSLRRMNQNVSNIISDVAEKPTKTHGFLYYAIASAAVLLIGISLLYHTEIIQPPKIVQQIPTEPTLTLAHLNAVFNNGGQTALDEYFEKAQIHRQPRADSVTLEDILKEL